MVYSYLYDIYRIHDNSFPGSYASVSYTHLDVYKRQFKWSVIASVAGLAFNVVVDPIVGYFYKQYILGQPQELAQRCV